MSRAAMRHPGDPEPLPRSDVETITIDEFGPLPVRRPASVAELGDLVREAVGSGRGVYPAGGRTTLDVGFPPIKPGVAVDTTALDQVIDYPARDMTITVRAGITVAKLQEVLAKEGQWLPVDVPQPERATIGGAVALNKSGPRRLGYGTLRDYVIGVSFVTDDGTEVKAGGRVVKNVAGYDLMKLQTGAVGTLGVITQLTLKVRPKPEAAAVVWMGCPPEKLADVLDRLHASRSRPVAVDVEPSTADVRALWGINIGFEEKAATVEWQISTLLDEVKSGTDVTACRGPDAENRWRAITAADVQHGGRRPSLVVKATVPPSQTAPFCEALAPGMYGSPLSLPTIFRVHAHALSGVVHGSTYDTGLTPAYASVILNRLTALAADCGGNLTVPQCPTEWKKTVPVWGRDAGDRELMRHVKRTLDPNNVFNPGRLFGDL
jgi:glycolate oxidase FAD binding subunit